MTLAISGPRRTFNLLKHRTDLEVDFAASWSDTLASLRLSGGNALRSLRIVQNETTGEGPRGDPFPFDGVTQLMTTLDGPDTEAVGPDVLGAAARDLLDPECSMSMVAEEHVIIPGRSAVKLLIFSRKRPDYTTWEYSKYWSTRHVDVILAQSDFRAYIRGYKQNHVVPESVRMISGGSVADGEGFDGIIEFWFDSVEDAKSAFETAGYRDNVRADEPKFLAQGRSIASFAKEIDH